MLNFIAVLKVNIYSDCTKYCAKLHRLTELVLTTIQFCVLAANKALSLSGLSDLLRSHSN